MTIKDVAFVAYSVADVPRSVAFYRDVVGLKPGQSFGEHWVEFDVGHTTFGVGNGEKIGIPPGSQHGAAFEVDDAAAMRESLKAKGVKVSDLNESPVCFSCFVTDPDGNRFALHQSKPRN
jgi:predicted enzyme related to lactoylglutathione lyase